MAKVDAQATLHLLVVEDDATDLEWLEVMLKNAKVCKHAESYVATLADAEAALQAHRFDCVLLDLSLPDADGLETVRRVLLADPLTPIVVFTHTDDLDVGLEAIDAGAQEYLVKGQANGSQILRAALFSAARAKASRQPVVASSGANGSFESIVAPWALLDGDLRVANANANFEALFGLSRGGATGGDFVELFAGDHAATFKAGTARVRSGDLNSFVRSFEFDANGHRVNAVASVTMSRGEPNLLLVMLTPARSS